jgi:hypothetical protein
MKSLIALSLIGKSIIKYWNTTTTPITIKQLTN